jgi:tryptophan synthase alpha chain
MTPTRIAKLFERLHGENRSALIAYVTAGDPTPDHTAQIVAALERGGADLIELGVPFSDPVGDGPVIQRGAERALQAGTSVKRVLEIAREIRATSEVPLLLFSYLNPLIRYGFGKLAADAKAAGIDGCLLIDLSVEEAEPFLAPMRACELDTVFLAAPTSPPERLAQVAEYSSGFIYLVSRTGVTGEQDTLSASAASLVAAVRKLSTLPLALGFGISTAQQAEQVAAFADGVVVGSAFVRIVEKYGTGDGLLPALESFARDLKQGCERGRHGK